MNECPTRGVLQGTTGSFSSPQYPLNYPNSVTCTWIIEVPEGYQVQLTFNTFKLEDCAISSICTCDHVEVRDGQTENSPSLKKHCGNEKPTPLRSSGRYMWVEFDSDSQTTEKGFNASFVAVCKCLNLTNKKIRYDSRRFWYSFFFRLVFVPLRRFKEKNSTFSSNVCRMKKRQVLKLFLKNLVLT